MLGDLLVEQVTEQGRQQIGRLDGDGVIIVGREPPPGGLTVFGDGVSREHGTFFRERSFWFYRDDQSTNGSWVNGKPLRGGHWRAVRPGDVIQMGAAAIQLLESEDAIGRNRAVVRTLLVFSGNDFVDEFPVQEYGRALVIGGAACDLEIEGDLLDAPSLVVERRGAHVAAFNIAKALPLLLNGEDTLETVSLEDGDELALVNYRVLFSDPPPSAYTKPVVSSWVNQAAVSPPGGMAALEAHRPGLGGSATGARSSSVFGRPSFEEDDSEFGGSAGEFGGYAGGGRSQDMRGLGSGSTYYQPDDYDGEGAPYSVLEDKVVLALIFVLVVVLVLGLLLFLLL